MKKRALSFALALCLLIFAALPAFAEGEDGTPPDTPLRQLAFGQHIWIGGEEYVVSKVPYCMMGGRAVRLNADENGEKPVYQIPPDPTRHSGLDLNEQTVAPTCSEEGYTYRLCKACGEKFITGTIPVDPDAHAAAGAFEVLEHPTCVTPGRQALRCKYCGELFAYEDMPALSLYHHADPDADWTTLTEADCSHGGVLVKYCAVCGEIAERKETPIRTDAHDWAEEFTVDAEPTCVADGSKSRHCLRCGAKTDVTAIPMEPDRHTFTDYFVTDTAATCREDGVMSRHCIHCALRVEETVIPAGEDHHVFLNEYKILREPTCAESGLKAHVCMVCGYQETPVLIPRAEHVFGEGVEQSRSADGRSRVMLYTCKNCGFEETRVENLKQPRENPDPLRIRGDARCRVDEDERLVWLVREGWTGDDVQNSFFNGWNYVLMTEAGAFKSGGDALVTGDRLVKDDGEDEAIVYRICIAGDVDADGRITARDARLALRISARLEKVSAGSMASADYSGDGNVTAGDARYILRYSAGLEPVRHPAWTN